MPRSVNSVASRARRKKILKETKGNFHARANVWTVAKNTYEKGLQYAYRDRKFSVHSGFRESTQLRVCTASTTLSLSANLQRAM